MGEAVVTSRAAALSGVYGVARGLLAGLPPSRLVEAPCGEGHLAVFLRDTGHRVMGGNLLPGRMADRRTPVVGWDLNAPLPFRDGAFDAVVALEGMEHLEGPYLPARELCRILRPHGVLVLSVPEILNLRSRAKFPALGTSFCFAEDGSRGGLHVNAIPLYEMQHILAEVGLAVEAVQVNHHLWGMRVAAGVLGPALRLAARVPTRSARLNAPGLLSGEVLLVRARKRRER